jgi:hypothetical protein
MAFFCALFISTELFAYKVRCNSEQTLCETETKRLVKGDAIGIFDEDDYLLALGHVTNIKGGIREIKLTKKFYEIGADARLERIEDNESKDPAKHFKIRRSIYARAYGVRGGFLSVGAGEGAMAFELDGFYQWNWRSQHYFLVKGMFGAGSGKASQIKNELTEYNFNMKAFALMGGYATHWISLDALDLRSEFDVGAVNVSVSASNPEVKAKELLDGKIFPGIGAMFGANLSAVTHIRSWDVSFTGQFWALQNSLSYALLVGVINPI